MTAEVRKYRSSSSREAWLVHLLVAPLMAATYFLIFRGSLWVLLGLPFVIVLVNSIIGLWRAEISVLGSTVTVTNTYRSYEFDAATVTLFVGGLSFYPRRAVVLVDEDGCFAVSLGVSEYGSKFRTLEKDLVDLGARRSTYRITGMDQFDLRIWRGSEERRVR